MTAISTDQTPTGGVRLAKVIGKNAVFGFTASAVQLLTRLVMIPIVIQHLGLDGYAIWSIVMATVGYMRLGTAGLRSAFQRYVAQAHVDGDIRIANKLLSTGTFGMAVLSLAALLPVVLYSHSLARLGGVPSRFLADTGSAIVLLAYTMIVANVGGVYEGILLGSHRLDLTRRFHILVTIGEAVAIIVILHFGHGLYGMAVTIAISEVLYILCCFLAARKIAPYLHISFTHVTSSVLRDLTRYALTYQCVNILELLYGVLVPVTILRHFGSDTAGVYALASRLVTVAMMGADALIPPLLTGGAMMFTAAHADTLTSFIKLSFTILLAVVLFPLGFVAACGPPLIMLWAGHTDPRFEATIWILSVLGLLSSISRLQLMFYRASGAALHDNVWQVLRLGLLLLLPMTLWPLDYYGTLAFLAAAEFVGVGYMSLVLQRAYSFFKPLTLIPETAKLIVSASIAITFASLTDVLPLPSGLGNRTLALISLTEGLTLFLFSGSSALLLTRALSGEHQRMLSLLFMPNTGTTDSTS
ncbi:MAG: hypothetical protein IT168_08000 [Bryobacterales bacterium]|nr:hypothetical protein [Bryobacterales bacterium]